MAVRARPIAAAAAATWSGRRWPCDREQSLRGNAVSGVLLQAGRGAAGLDGVSYRARMDGQASEGLLVVACVKQSRVIVSNEKYSSTQFARSLAASRLCVTLSILPSAWSAPSSKRIWTIAEGSHLRAQVPACGAAQHGTDECTLLLLPLSYCSTSIE